MVDSHPITVASIKQLAKERLPESVWTYYITGSDDERTANRNESIYDRQVLSFLHFVALSVTELTSVT